MYRAFSEQYGWTPKQISQLTGAQIQMYSEIDDDVPGTTSIVREDDWSQFGLRLDSSSKLRSDEPGALERYRAWKIEQEKQGKP